MNEHKVIIDTRVTLFMKIKIL